jgi:mono/diheme cytochrome c family protein
MNRRLTLAVVAVLAAAACSPQPRTFDPVVRGRRDFMGLGCVKCHRIGDAGNAWGPNLTLVGFRKSPEWIRTWLKNPHAWNEKTVMPNFALTDRQLDDLVAFLSAQKGQAWKVYPWRTAQAKALPPVQRGRLIFKLAGCVACHGWNAKGGYPNNNVAGGLIPSLTMVSVTYTKAELHSKIEFGVTPLPADPSKPKPLIYMPKWGQQLKPDEIDALVAYLFTLAPKTSQNMGF